jgi:adenine C2-methylase RlmN of 23S rRNA A2503 and tRNA A37
MFSCNVLYMQVMGKPMNNYNALVEPIRVFTEHPFQLSPKRITVSTVSIIGYYFYSNMESYS